MCCKPTAVTPPAKSHAFVPGCESAHHAEPQTDAIGRRCLHAPDPICDSAMNVSSAARGANHEITLTVLKGVGQKVVKNLVEVFSISENQALRIAAHRDLTTIARSKDAVDLKDFFEQITQIDALGRQRYLALLGAGPDQRSRRAV